MFQPTEYKFKGFWGCRSRCGLEVIRHRSFDLVIATEMADNPGTSVTNVAEHLATAVCKDWGIPARSLVWVEHYPKRDSDFEPYVPDESWDLVQFYLDPAQGRFANPVWFRLSEEQMDLLRAGSKPRELTPTTRNVP